MHSVENKVCDNRESGTDDEVFLVFRSTKSKPGGINICCTEILDTGIIGHSINDWGRDVMQRWGHKHSDDQDHHFLGSCAKDFRLYDNLEVKVMIPRGRVLT